MDMSIPFHVLEQATDGFSDRHVIGTGGYGKVYKGIYYGEEVAVKVFHDVLDNMPFENEFLNILRIQHPNVVRLFGYCYETQSKYVEYNGFMQFARHIYKILCFELLHGGSLEKYLFVSGDHDWPTRYNIIKGTCQGLSFLHEGCGKQILHLDLTPANILLDNNMRPKVADFGLSRFVSKTHTHITSTTTGKEFYMAPEFRLRRQISPKNDVYSLGVVIIEILAGQRGYMEFCEMEDVTPFIEMVITNWREWINATTSSCPSAELAQVETCIKIAIKCVDYERMNRPTIAEILDTLQETEKRFHLMGKVIDMLQRIKAFSKKQLPNLFSMKVEGGSGISMGMANKIMDASTDREDQQLASSVLENIILDESAEPTNVPLALLQHITEDFADKRQIGGGGFEAVCMVIDMLQRIKALSKKLLPNLFFMKAQGASWSSMGRANKIMAASTDREDLQLASSVLENIILDESAEPTNVPLALLQHITEDFADKRQIGRGGFGVVYKGSLKNGSSVAIKRLCNTHIDEGPFYREATFLINVKHKNIVRLLGYCANTEWKAVPNPNQQEETMTLIFVEIRERLLCFEYIKNGSLDKYLTDELSGLEWQTRYKVIKDICNGLDYLHNEKGIIHRDLKPANILLDNFMVPKITDFGISKHLDGVTHAVTSDSTMAIGYTAPEFVERGVVSFKSDTYSLGGIITELMTGRKGDPDIKNVCRRWRHRWNKSVQYPPFGYQQVTKCIEIASMCLSHSPKERPYVRDILSMLNAIESTDVQSNGTGESSVGPISPYPWELLEFDKLELNFPFEINKQIPCSIELTNVTDGDTAFDIQKPGILTYCIEPSKGVVPARSKCTVIVTLQAREVAPYHTMCKDEFVVRCATVNEGLIAEDIHEDMFNQSSGKLVDEVMLTVVVECVTIT